MALVEYSESEGSDAEQPARPEPKAKPAAAKPAFHKVVDRANPGKIKVSLPGANGAGVADDGDGERPAKRQRSGGLGGFNSFLPAPKNAAAAKGSAAGDGAKPRSLGLGRGVSLKTGSAPAFSREPVVEEVADVADEHNDYDNDNGELGADAAFETTDFGTESLEMAPPVARKPMFRPLSVGRKPDKKKKKAQDVVAAPASNSQSTPQNGKQQESTSAVPKRSLFSVESNEPEEAPADNGEYKYFLQDNVNGSADGQTEALNQQAHAQAEPADLDAMAASMNLTPAQRRQLFGRKGKADGAMAAQFSVASEYQRNKELLASGEAETGGANAVRAIAPGRHTLQQLLNQVYSQGEALEESFAQGRRNRAEAGSKYGW